MIKIRVQNKIHSVCVISSEIYSEFNQYRQTAKAATKQKSESFI